MDVVELDRGSDPGCMVSPVFLFGHLAYVGRGCPSYHLNSDHTVIDQRMSPHNYNRSPNPGNVAHCVIDRGRVSTGYPVFGRQFGHLSTFIFRVIKTTLPYL